ncbi:MAG: hypothetical protein HRU09_14475 [Oligoflexales bacterium]|nr:hypothetical protein [Oligoflexales bacterium]
MLTTDNKTSVFNAESVREAKPNQRLMNSKQYYHSIIMQNFIINKKAW